MAKQSSSVVAAAFLQTREVVVVVVAARSQEATRDFHGVLEGRRRYLLGVVEIFCGQRRGSGVEQVGTRTGVRGDYVYAFVVAVADSVAFSNVPSIPRYGRLVAIPRGRN